MASWGELETNAVRTAGGLTRVAAVAAVVAVAIVAAVVLLRGSGENYTVKAHFQNASQLVKGNLVQVSGAPVGKVTDISLTRNGQAEVKMRINDDYAPLRRGTRVTVRQSSLSGVANRYLDLQLPPHGAAPIDNGGVIEQDHTTTAVDLDQLFNVFDPPTRKALQGVIRGSGKQYAGKGEAMNAGLAYLNPSLAASSRLFRELNYDTPLLENFVVASSKLVTDVADRRDRLAGLIDHLATTTTAIGDEHDALADAINRLPAFLRRADTTFVNLRATLGDLDPLVEDSKPVAKKLRPFLAQLRPLAKEARPTLRDLSGLLGKTGANNDLVDLTKSAVPLANVATRSYVENGKEREGAFPASTKALSGTAPEIGFFRPYSPDLMGWFDDFTHSGFTDALGGVSRAAPHVSAFEFLNGQLSPVKLEDRQKVFESAATLNQNNRCPGAAEHVQPDNSVPYKPDPNFNCDPRQVLPGN
jgi:phospholipid/cholesterol/gamma-HCH transport system substrate-binding protein